MKKWTLMIGILIGAVAVALAAFAAAPLSALAQGEAAPVVASRLVDRLHGVFSADSHGGRGGGADGLVSATASVTGLTTQEVVTQLQAGKSLAQIAQEHGKSADDILAKLREKGQQRLDQALNRAKDLINQPGLGRQNTPQGASPTAGPAK